MFSKFFGKPSPDKKQQKKNATESINVLRKAIQKLEKREIFLNKRIEQITKEVQLKVKQKNKKGALACLKKKKMLEKQVDNIMGKAMNLENQIMTLEDAVMNVEVVNAMRQGASAVTKQVNNINIDDVDEMRDDMAEAQDRNEEINTALGDPMGFDLDDDDLLMELNELEDLNAAEELEALDSSLPDINFNSPNINQNTTVQPPGVINSQGPQQQNIMDDEEKELMALMS